MTPCLIKIARIFVVTKSGYLLEVKDDAISEKQFNVNDETLEILVNNGDLRDEYW